MGRKCALKSITDENHHRPISLWRYLLDTGAEVQGPRQTGLPEPDWQRVRGFYWNNGEQKRAWLTDLDLAESQ